MVLLAGRMLERELKVVENVQSKEQPRGMEGRNKNGIRNNTSNYVLARSRVQENNRSGLQKPTRRAN